MTSPRQFTRRWLISLLLVLTIAHPTFARDDHDPQPPLRWSEMLSCRIVVLARYQSHRDKTLTLTVLRVLHGDGLKPGDSLKVALENRYSCQDGDRFFSPLPPGVTQSTAPQICYQVQMGNPGPLVPVPLSEDARDPLVYFFPDADAPALSRPGQVQAAVLSDGWQQALHQQPMPLTFRVGQTVNPVLQRDAQEELYSGRDPATLDTLFAWVFDQPRPVVADVEPLLASLGDRDGDVYNRALALYQRPARPQDRQTWPSPTVKMGHVMARSDPHRALAEFRREEKVGGPKADQYAFVCADYCGTEEALDVGFGLLKKPQTVESGLSLLRGMLCPGMQAPQPYLPADKLAALREYARPRLLAVLNSPLLTGEQKKECLFFGAYGGIAKPLPSVDLTHAEAVLLDPAAQTYDPVPWIGNDGNNSRPSYTLLEEIRTASDPSFIPLLVRVLHEHPQALLDSTFGTVLVYYSKLYPRSMERQIELQGLTEVWAKSAVVNSDNTVDRMSLWRDVTGGYRAPQTAEGYLCLTQRPVRRVQAKKIGMPPALVRELVTDSGMPDGQVIAVDYLEPVLRFDPALGLPVLKRTLGSRSRYDALTRAKLLRLALQYVPSPNPLHVTELLTLLREADDKALEEARRSHRDQSEVPQNPQNRWDRLALEVFSRGDNVEEAGHWSGTSFTAPDLAPLYRERLRSVDALKPVSIRGYGGQISVLLLRHPADCVPRILALLASPSLPDREVAEEALVANLHWDFGFHSADFAAQRASEMAVLRPRLMRYVSLTEAQMRADVLRAQGIIVSGTPQLAWLPTLSRAALRLDPAVSGNAFDLIGTITGEIGLDDLRRASPDTRKVALARFYADHDVKVNAL